VGRLYLAPFYLFGDQAFDNDGSRVSTHAKLQMFNIGAAIEFGFTQWITAALQWTPGYNVWSDIDMTLPHPNSSANISDMGDLFAGAKLQLVGSAAPFRSEAIRLAFAPGVKIPLPGPDYKKQVENLAKGNDVTVSGLDKHVLGVGLRSYFDFIVNENFFVNLYNEFIYYPVKGDLKDAGFTEYMTLNTVNAALAPMGSSVKGEVDYGFDCTFEIEPAFSMNIAPLIQFNAGLPVSYKVAPPKVYHFKGTGPAGAAGEGNMEVALPEGEMSHLLSVKPNASVFFMGWVLPVEFKLVYTAPLWGKNTQANNIINFQVRAYFKI